MEVKSLNAQILQQIIECFYESQKTCSDQRIIYNKLQYIVENVPEFFCYFIHILISNLQSDSNNMLYSQLSLFCIRSYFKNIRPEDTEHFLSTLIPALLNIISNGIDPLISYSAILMASLIEYYGEQAIPNFDNVLSMLISNENTIAAGIDAMVELSENKNLALEEFGLLIPNNKNKYIVKIEHLQQLIAIFQNIPNSDLTGSFLLIILNLMKSTTSNLYSNFISSEILNFININYLRFQGLSLLYSMRIIIPYFEKTGDLSLGNFISYCIQNLNDLAGEGLDSFSNEIPFHQGLIVSLFDYLQIEDENCSESAQEVLLNMSIQYEAVAEIISQLISKSSNPSQILKSLCSICDQLPNADDFFQYAMEHLHDESRGHAAVFLSQISTSENSYQIVSELIPLVLDQDKNVQEKVLDSLDTIFQSDFQFKVEMSWIPPLLQAFMISVNENDFNSSTYLSRIIYNLLDCIENLNDELFQNLFKFVYELFFSDEKNQFLLPAALLIEILLKKLKIGYSAGIDSIINRMTDTLQTNEVFFQCREQYFSLMICMIELYQNQVTSLLAKPLLLATLKFNEESLITPSEFFWEAVIHVFKLTPELQNEPDFSRATLLLALKCFSINNLRSVDLISIFIGFYVKSFNEETVDNLFMATANVLQNCDNINNLRNAVALLKLILEYKEEKKTLKPEYVQFHAAVVSQLTET